jgi:UDP-N-acetylmuramoyl-L-alanyl-D-glutamate--2,6-diaminopimelate ligase
VRLSSLVTEAVRMMGAGDPEVLGLSCDSRTVEPGWLFAALSGGRHDGRRYTGEALAAGAVAMLGDATVARIGLELGIPALVADDPRRALALTAARFYAPQPRTIVAVTGTNGKTSTVSFARQLWRRLGVAAAGVGTLGVTRDTGTEGGGLTTPDPVRLHAILAALASEGIEHVAMEASSHALDQRRLDGVMLRAAAFTNLTRDHLDYHGTLKRYLAAKSRLFDSLLPAGGAAVINADVPEHDRLAAIARERGLAVLDVGRAAGALRLLDQRPHARGQHLELDLLGHRISFDSPLIGHFQAANLLAAIGLVIAGGTNVGDVVPHLGDIEGAPGRMQLVAHHPSGAAVFVDYAHTPDALEQALGALRAHTAGRLVVVFGAGGDRDVGKRPLMGAVAASGADRVIVTDDNPRTEDPARIRRQVLDGCPGAEGIGERAGAIRRALEGLVAGDVLLIAGKGHETGQIVGDHVLPFDDAAVARACVAELAGAAP